MKYRNNSLHHVVMDDGKINLNVLGALIKCMILENDNSYLIISTHRHGHVSHDAHVL